MLSISTKAWILTQSATLTSWNDKHHVIENSLDATGYFVIFRISGRSFYLDCTSLEIYLHQCQLLNQNQLSEQINLFRIRNPQSQNFGLEGLGNLSVAATVQSDNEFSRRQQGVPMCTCLRFHSAFSNFITFTVTPIHVREENCKLRLKPTGLGQLEAILTEANLAHNGIQAISRKLVDMVEDSLPRLEAILKTRVHICPLDQVATALLCLYVNTGTDQAPPRSAGDMRCTRVYLSGSSSKDGAGTASGTRGCMQTITFVVLLNTVCAVWE